MTLLGHHLEPLILDQQALVEIQQMLVELPDLTRPAFDHQVEFVAGLLQRLETSSNAIRIQLDTFTNPFVMTQQGLVEFNKLSTKAC